MELAFLLRGVGAEVVWITNQKPAEPDEVFPVKDQKAIDAAIKADLVVLNTAVAGKWLDAVWKENVQQVPPKVLWWIHEMRGHYFKLEIKMPETYVVHIGNSKDLVEVAEDNVAKRVLGEHIRESLGVRNDDMVFAIINGVSCWKGQDLFLRSFYESLQLIQEKKLQVPSLHAVVVGSDLNAKTKFEGELCKFVQEKKIQDRVFIL